MVRKYITNKSLGIGRRQHCYAMFLSQCKLSGIKGYSKRRLNRKTSVMRSDLMKLKFAVLSPTERKSLDVAAANLKEEQAKRRASGMNAHCPSCGTSVCKKLSAIPPHAVTNATSTPYVR